MSNHAATTPQDLIADRETLVLSPHMDDALLSASSLVLGVACEVWTVFAGQPVPPQTTTWDTRCGFANSDETIMARRLEDAAAFAGTPATTRHLDALEGAYATREQRYADMEFVAGEIDAWMTAHPTGCVVLPAGAGRRVPPPPWEDAVKRVKRLTHRGVVAPAPASVADFSPSYSAATSPVAPSTTDAGESTRSRLQATARSMFARAAKTAKRPAQRALHAEYVHRRRKAMGSDGLAANPDHLALRDSALQLAERHPEVRVVLFEELPYLWHARGDDEIARRIVTPDTRAVRTVLPVDRDLKHSHLAHYVSQLPVLDSHGRLERADTLPGEEVYWVLARSGE